MSNKRSLPQRIVLLTLTIMILALVACQGREQLGQEAATIEAAAENVDVEVATGEATEVSPAPEPGLSRTIV